VVICDWEANNFSFFHKFCHIAYYLGVLSSYAVHKYYLLHTILRKAVKIIQSVILKLWQNTQVTPTIRRKRLCTGWPMIFFLVLLIIGLQYSSHLISPLCSTASTIRRWSADLITRLELRDNFKLDKFISRISVNVRPLEASIVVCSTTRNRCSTGVGPWAATFLLVYCIPLQSYPYSRNKLPPICRRHTSLHCCFKIWLSVYTDLDWNLYGQCSCLASNEWAATKLEPVNVIESRTSHYFRSQILPSSLHWP